MKITFVGLGGCPFSNRAADVRQNAFAEVFVEMGYEVEIINRFSRTKAKTSFPLFRVVEPFPYIEAKGKFTFAFFYILALLYEPFRLLHSNRKCHIDVVYVYSAHTIDHLMYWLFCRMVGAKLVGQYNEYNSCTRRNAIYFRANRRYIDRLVPRLWDGAICISHFLEKVCHDVSPKTKTMLVYPICNFISYNKKEDEKEVLPQQDFVLFCSSISYISIVEFIIKAYCRSELYRQLDLVMVLSGNEEHLTVLKNKYPEVIFLHDLKYGTLISYYRNAKALLIPLRDNLRDKARFPHKVCEYLASNGLVITTNLGEMPYVFNDGMNALVAEGYNIETYAQKLSELIAREDLDIIKENGYQTGLMYFDIHAYESHLDVFFNELIGKESKVKE